MLVFGRAALLGLSGGENNCDSSYPRCPRNEVINDISFLFFLSPPTVPPTSSARLLLSFTACFCVSEFAQPPEKPQLDGI